MRAGRAACTACHRIDEMRLTMLWGTAQFIQEPGFMDPQLVSSNVQACLDFATCFNNKRLPRPEPDWGNPKHLRSWSKTEAGKHLNVDTISNLTAGMGRSNRTRIKKPMSKAVEFAWRFHAGFYNKTGPAVTDKRHGSLGTKTEL